MTLRDNRPTVQLQSPPTTPRQQALRLADEPTIAAAYATANQPKGIRTRQQPAKGKPLFDWITRKLGAGRRATYSDGNGRPSEPAPSRAESVSLRSYSYANSAERDRRREANNPYPSIPVPPRVDSTYDSVSLSFLSRSRTPSIRSEGSRPREADEDASLRPIAPSHPSSPSRSVTSRSISLLSPIPRSHLSRTTSIDSLSRHSRRDSASTKPTTMSIDSGPYPAHIAQASPLASPAATIAGPSRLPATNMVQAPKHTHPHPRDNPRPSSPPGANASTLTLASSTFATAPINYLPTARVRDLSTRPNSLSATPSVTFASPDRPASSYEYNPNAPSVYALSGYGPSLRGYGRVDKDASVRALRRRGSSDSDQSRWSWKGQGKLDEADVGSHTVMA